jgi:hypothetical protein
MFASLVVADRVPPPAPRIELPRGHNYKPAPTVAGCSIVIVLVPVAALDRAG